MYWTLDSGYDGSVTFDVSSGFANLSASNIIYDQDQDLLSVDITNSGEVAAWDIGVAYNFNSDPSGDCEYGNVDDVFILDGIAAGETVTFSVNGLEAYIGFGTHEIHVVVDYYCTVEESDEGDNTANTSVTITDPLEGVTFNVYRSLDDGSGIYSFYQVGDNVVGDRTGNNMIHYLDDGNGNGLAAGDYVYYVTQIDDAGASESAESDLAFATVQDLMYDFSLSFDGNDDYVEIPSPAIYDTVVNEISVEAWVNMTELPESNNTIIARRNYDGTEKHHFEFNITSGGGLYFGTSNNQNDELNTAQVETEPGLISAGGWHHVAATFDNGYVRFYVDGAFVTDHDHGYKEMWPNNHWVNIGRVHRSGGQAFFNEFNGSIDEVRLWDKALTDEHISANFNSHLSGLESNLLGYWNFNEGTGDIVGDMSGNGLEGQIFGATWMDDSPFGLCKPMSLSVEPGNTVNVLSWSQPGFDLVDGILLPYYEEFQNEEEVLDLWTLEVDDPNNGSNLRL